MIDKIVVYLCKFISKICVFLGGGSSLPGRIALKLRPGILSYLAKGQKVVMVTGTNGKTTTSAMITEILKKAGKTVINNSSGANMIDGITTCFISQYPEKGWAVLECDEAYTRLVNKFIRPEFMVVTNIFRDQLDRFGEVSTTWGKIREAIYISPKTHLVLNADQALFANLDFPNPIHYFGFSKGFKEMAENVDSSFCPECGEKLKFNHVTFKNLGDYYCPKCDFKRPLAEYTLDEVKSISSDGSEFSILGRDIKLHVSGIYNIYNALSAFAVCHLAGIDGNIIESAIREHRSKFGRNENIKIGETELLLSLVKNPTGCDQCIDTISMYQEPCTLLLMLNDNWGDGTDISWIWDSDIEKLSKMQYEKILIGGTRLYDMAIRVKNAGLDTDKFIMCDSDDAVIDEVKKCKGRVFALCTYTAMTNLRKTMYTKGIVKEMWK